MRGENLMQSCENCGEKFTWKQIWKSMNLAYRPIYCKKCGTVYKVPFDQKWKVAFIISFPLLILEFFSFPIFEVSLRSSLIILLSWTVVVMLSLPFTIRYKKIT
ncbi:TIGR04104 family putative zinc finger protein [Paenisporosarcina cavernae]|uniref:Cxxc_20_cxxc protein n=1 Tax=Paenisporosarcina cavernae TaxID=2320858 RepID=A0A385YV17_9BACL|nr:hypothetical protein D3873_12105 [Paenisporosarcina cavernae]